MPTKITSLSNPKVKRVLQLRKSAQRKDEGLTIIEGTREVAAALDARIRIDELYVLESKKRNASIRKIVEACEKAKVAVYEASESVFEKISYGEQRDGIIAIGKPCTNSLSSLKVSAQSLFVIVEEVEKPGNVGAILRTCDAAGVNAVLFCNPKTDLYNPNVIRASLGAVFSVPAIVASCDEIFMFLKSHKIKICASLPQADMLYTQADYKNAVAIVVGSEDDGLTQFWQDKADMRVRIPMKGKMDSLNVSTATGILLYEAIRQRNKSS